jgi:hypothetical protein
MDNPPEFLTGGVDSKKRKLCRVHFLAPPRLVVIKHIPMFPRYLVKQIDWCDYSITVGLFEVSSELICR